MLPHFSIAAGSTFSVNLAVGVGRDSNVGSFRVSITVPARLSVTSVEFADASLFSGEVFETSRGVYAVTAGRGYLRGTNRAKAMATSGTIPCTLNLTLKDTFTVAEVLSVSATIEDLTDDFGFAALEMPAAVTFDDREGVHSASGSIYVKAGGLTKLANGYATISELINTAVIDGVVVESSVVIEGVWANGTTSAIPASSGDLRCTSVEPTVVNVATDCSKVYLDGSEIKGAANASITVNHALLDDAISFLVTILFPELPVEISGAFSELGVIRGTGGAGDGECDLIYQRLDLTASATFFGILALPTFQYTFNKEFYFID